jgi:hypothetical protein
MVIRATLLLNTGAFGLPDGKCLNTPFFVEHAGSARLDLKPLKLGAFAESQTVGT